jgi:phosphoglycerate dehydrogenase-like enzyme
MLKVAFVGTFSGRLAEPVRALLDLPCEIITTGDHADPTAFGDADVLVSLVFTREMAAATKRLKLVQVPGAGLDRIDQKALPAGAALANAYNHENGIAEHAIGAMLALARNFVGRNAALRQGRWDGLWEPGGAPSLPSLELAGRTLGILGYGRIGQRLARFAYAFDMRVLAVRRSPDGHAGDGIAMVGGRDSLPAMLRESDFLAITLSLDASSRRLIDARALGLMKPTAFIVNVARGEAIDEDALYEALAAGRIAGAALDVWYRYPTGPEPTMPANRPFHELPNVLMTPHVSGWTEGTLTGRARVIAENLARVARGERPVNAVVAGA